MAKAPSFTTIGRQSGNINVLLSYKIVDLFSEGLYSSPNKAIEELVANSFDAGAKRVQVILSSDLQAEDATIVVIDDGQGMGAQGLREHWLIGTSNKRTLSKLPAGRQQIGKFGIGKLATYVLSSRLSHVSKHRGAYYSTSMDYRTIDRRVDKQVEPKSPIKIPLRKLTEVQAKTAVARWVDSKEFKAAHTPLFGKNAPESWTVTIMSSLKAKVHEIRPGLLKWILSTALPLRDDFSIHLNGQKLVSSKAERGRLKSWRLGKDLKKLPKPCPPDVEPVQRAEDNEYGLSHPAVGFMHGYVETYKDLLTGKSDQIGRSHGFFVYVRERLVNVLDDHFGIPPDELRHGTFGRFRCVIHMDGLDHELRSNRESVREGPTLEAARDILRAIFNAARAQLSEFDAGEAPGAQLARKLAAAPGSISRRPIVALARAVVEGRVTTNYLIVPKLKAGAERDLYVKGLEERATQATQFVTGLTLSFDSRPDGGIALYDTTNGQLLINAWHPFVATFHDEFAGKNARQPLEVFAMAEVLLEAHMHGAGVKESQIEETLAIRDQLLRNLANESGRQSALSISNNLLNARNNPDGLQDRLNDAFGSLGFEITPLGAKGQPDGVGTAYLSADANGSPRRYAVSLEAKSKQQEGTKVSAKSVGISTIARQRDTYECDHALVVGPSFPERINSALADEIKADREHSKPKTISLITIDDLARLVRLAPIKQLGLVELRAMFNTCSLPSECKIWIDAIEMRKVKKPPYRQIIDAIHKQSREFSFEAVTYSALRVELKNLTPSIKFETDTELAELCKGMAKMAPGAISATDRSVELDQSPANVLNIIETATRDYAGEGKK